MDVTAYSVVLSVQFVFASYQIMTKIVFEHTDVDPVAFAFLRLVGAAVIFWVMVAFTVPAKYMWPRPEHKSRVARMGFFMFGNVMGLVLALSYTSSAMVAMLQVLRPIFAGVISWTLGLERPTWRQIVGLLLCVMGGVAIVGFSHPQVAVEEVANPLSVWHSWVGAGLVCFHSFCIAFYVLEQPQLINAGCSALAINAQAYTLACALGLFVMLIPGRYTTHNQSQAWLPQDAFSWLTILHAVLLVACYSYMAMAWAAKKLGGVIVMLFMLLQAVIILIAGKFLLKETLYSGQLAGALLFLLGILTFILDPNAGPNAEAIPIFEKEGRECQDNEKPGSLLESAKKLVSSVTSPISQ